MCARQFCWSFDCRGKARMRLFYCIAMLENGDVCHQGLMALRTQCRKRRSVSCDRHTARERSEKASGRPLSERQPVFRAADISLPECLQRETFMETASMKPWVRTSVALGSDERICWRNSAESHKALDLREIPVGRPAENDDPRRQTDPQAAGLCRIER
jgi:hypothetical protein